MSSDVERRYGVPLAHDALLCWLGERYGPAAEEEARAVYRAAARRYQRAAKVRAAALWLRRHPEPRTAAELRRTREAEALTADPTKYIDGGK